MFLFDTDTVSSLMRPAPSTALIRRLAQVPVEQQFVSSITVGEVAYGAYKSGRQDQIWQRFEQSILGDLTVLPFDFAAASVYGRVRAQLERSGMSVAEPDLRIAAIAIARSLTLVTGNIRHFIRVPGLTVENWLSA